MSDDGTERTTDSDDGPRTADVGATFVESGVEFTRDMNYIPTRITADGRDGYPVEPGRYRLVVARACPWANRAIIVRRLLGLEDVLSMGICGPTHDERSWTFDLDPGGVDPVLKIPRLQDAYFARFPGYPRGITVPAIVEIATGQVVTNDFAQITLDLSTEWKQFHRDGAPDLYPEDLRDEIDKVADLVFRDVNNGVYRCGFAGSQDAYDAAYDRLFERLDWLTERLSTQRFLVGDTRQIRPLGHDQRRIDVLVDDVVVLLDLGEVDRVSETGRLEQVPRVVPQHRHLRQFAPVALEVPVVDGVEAGERREQADVGLGERTGSSRTTGRSSAATPSATALPRTRRARTRLCRCHTGPPPNATEPPSRRCTSRSSGTRLDHHGAGVHRALPGNSAAAGPVSI